jgi:metal-responsive CopG/Arc/MetJ family transcriptional regulator
MRTTINIEDDLLDKAVEYSGIKERSTIFRMALEEFVQRRAELRIARLKGSMPDFGKVPVRRRRPLPE